MLKSIAEMCSKCFWHSFSLAFTRTMMRAPTIAKVVTAAKSAIMHVAYYNVMTFRLHFNADPLHGSVSLTLADTASEKIVIIIP